MHEDLKCAECEVLRQSLSGDFVKRCKARRAEKQWGGAAWAVQKKINEDQRRGRWARARFQCRCALGGNVRCTGDVRGDYAQMLCKQLQVLRFRTLLDVDKSPETD